MSAIHDHASVSERRRQVVLVSFEDNLLLDLAGPAEVLNVATWLLGGNGGYQVAVASSGGRPVRGASGLRLSADLALGQVRARGLDTLVVPGGMNLDAALGDPCFIPEIRRLAAGARRTCSVCTGAFLLAASGLLDGRRATTHWAFSGELQRRYPAVRLEPNRIFVRDGNVTTSAGVTAGIDLALALVEEDHGPKLARTVARWIVVFLQRPGGQAQFSERLALPADIGSPSGPSSTGWLQTPPAITAKPSSRTTLPCRSVTSGGYSRSRRRRPPHGSSSESASKLPGACSRPQPPPPRRSRHGAVLARAKRCAARFNAHSALHHPNTATASSRPSRWSSPRKLASQRPIPESSSATAPSATPT